MSGIELQNQLRAKGDKTAVVFITAHPEESIRRHALDAGAIHFFSKPFDGAEILNAVYACHRLTERLRINDVASS